MIFFLEGFYRVYLLFFENSDGFFEDSSMLGWIRFFFIIIEMLKVLDDEEEEE